MVTDLPLIEFLRGFNWLIKSLEACLVAQMVTNPPEMQGTWV